MRIVAPFGGCVNFLFQFFTLTVVIFSNIDYIYGASQELCILLNQCAYTVDHFYCDDYVKKVGYAAASACSTPNIRRNCCKSCQKKLCPIVSSKLQNFDNECIITDLVVFTFIKFRKISNQNPKSNKQTNLQQNPISSWVEKQIFSQTKANN